MAYDEQLAGRLREAIEPGHRVEEKKMFGGLCFMLDGNMLCGVSGTDYMFRVGADGAGEALALAHVRPCDFTGRPMKGLVLADGGKLAGDDFHTLSRLAHTFVGSLPEK